MEKNLKTEIPTYESVWAVLMENSKQLQESRLQLERTNAILDEKFRETDEKFRETSEKFRETDKKFRETSEKFRETDLKFRETDEKFNKTDEKIKRVSEQIGGLSKSLGEQTEYFFYSGIKREMTLVGDNFHTITKKVRGINGWEYDIVLTNFRKVCVLEVKHKFEKKHLQRFLDDKIPNFKVEFPQYTDYEIIPAIASLHFLENTIELAHHRNVLVLGREGKGIVRL